MTDRSIPADLLTRVEFESAVRKMSINKAVGPDGVPAEAFKYSTKARGILFLIIQQIWEQEELTESNPQLMLFKNKGGQSPNDPTKYRCIGLLNHVFKVLSLITLERTLSTSETHLQD